MDQRGYFPYIYSPFQSSVELPSSQEPHRYGSQGPTTPKPYQESFDGNTCYTAVAQDWQVNTFPGSPSAASTLSGSDGFSTPRYLEQQPLPAFCLAEQPLPALISTTHATSHPDWNIPLGSHPWQGEYRNTATWSAPQTFAVQPWHGGNNFYHSSMLTAVVPSTPQLIHETAHDMIQSTVQGVQYMNTQPKAENNAYNEEDDDLITDDECDSGDYLDEDESHTTESSPKSTASKIKVHKFAAHSHNHSRGIQATCIRPHSCTLPDMTNPQKMCGKRFVRPEHLRRHKNTVHVPDNDKFPTCKVPHCRKRFSRGDNLREHYFTHVERGGRASKNIKMELQELKQILGPGAKSRELYVKIVKKYRAKMAATRQKS